MWESLFKIYRADNPFGHRRVPEIPVFNRKIKHPVIEILPVEYFQPRKRNLIDVAETFPLVCLITPLYYRSLTVNPRSHGPSVSAPFTAGKQYRHGVLPTEPIRRVCICPVIVINFQGVRGVEAAVNVCIPFDLAHQFRHTQAKPAIRIPPAQLKRAVRA